jgi:hypothetical protein
MAVEARRDTAWDGGVFQAICLDHGAEAGLDLSDHDLRDANRDDSSWFEELEELDALGVFVSGEWPEQCGRHDNRRRVRDESDLDPPNQGTQRRRVSRGPPSPTSPLPSSPRAITTAASAAPSPPPPPPQSLSPPVEPNTQPVAELEGEGTWGLEVAQRVAEESRVELVCLVPDVFAGASILWLSATADEPQPVSLQPLIHDLKNGRNKIPANAMLCYQRMSDGAAVFGPRDTVRKSVNHAQYYLKPELRLPRFQIAGSFPPPAPGRIGATQVSLNAIGYSKSMFLPGMSPKEVADASHCQKCQNPEGATIRKIITKTAVPMGPPLGGQLRSFWCETCAAPAKDAAAESGVRESKCTT